MADDIVWPDDPGPSSGYDTGTPAGTNTPPAGAAAPPAPPAAGANGNPPAPDSGGAPGATGDDEHTRRYDELNSRFTALERNFTTTQEEAAYWRRIANAALGREGPPAPPSPDDERRGRIRDAILNLFPELKEIQTLRESREADNQERTRQADAFATKAITAALDHVASTILGAGKTHKDLTPQQASWTRKAFIDWVLDDPARRTAFDGGEMPNVNQFWTEYTQHMVAGSVRATNADVERRAGKIAALPSGGPSQAPVGTPPPDLNYQDEAAVHKAGWAAATAGR